MTEHNIEELRRQYMQAYSRADEAVNLKDEALNRLNIAIGEEMLAKLAERGVVPGVKVLHCNEIYIFSGTKVMGYNLLRPLLAKIKKDGTAHKSRTLWVSSPDNITLYSGTAS